MRRFPEACTPKPFPRIVLDPFHPEDLEWVRYRDRLTNWLELGYAPACWRDPLHDIISDIRRVQGDWRIQLTHGRKGSYWEFIEMQRTDPSFREILRLTQDADMS